MPRFIFTLLLFSSSSLALRSAPPAAPTVVSADLGLPIVRRSNFTDAPVSGPVWAMVETVDGTRWIGSNLLAAYDGVRWETINLPSAYAFRGLAPDVSGRLWVGAVGAMGYISRDASGQWSFTSLLSELLRDGGATPSDIWQVCALGHGAVFVTTEWILRWDGGKFEKWHRPGVTRLQAFARGDQVLIYQNGAGLLRLGATGEPELELAETELPEHPVTWHVALPGGGALIGLADSAYWQSSDGKLSLLSELSQALHGTLPSCALILRPDLVAIGTFKSGLVFTTATGKPVNTLNEAKGLSDETIYSLGRGSDETLWAGLGTGAIGVEPPDRVTTYNGGLGLKGTPLKVITAGGLTCILTTKTVLELAAAGPTSTLAPQPRLWDANVIDDTLWAGGFGGLWRKSGASWIHEYHVSADVSRLISVRRLPHTVVFAENYTLKALQAGPAGWVATDLGQSVNDTPLSLLEDEGGDLWVSTLVGGIYRYAWSSGSDPDRPPALHRVAHYTGGYGLPGGTTRPLLTRLGDRLYAFSAQGILQLNRAGTGFETVRELDGFVGISGTALSNEDRPAAYWLVRSRLLEPVAPPSVLRVSLSKTSSSTSTLGWKPVHAVGLNSNGPSICIDFVDSPGGKALWATHSADVVRIPESELADPSPPPTVSLQEVEVGSTRLPCSEALPPFPTKTLHLAFRYKAATRENGAEVYYQTRLNGPDSEWSVPSPQPIREYDGLAPGRHLFAVRALDGYGRPGLAAEIVFTISTPWYRTSAALAGYALLAIAGGMGWMRWRSNRLRRQNERLNQLVTERTRELELSNTAKSEFLENVSHEIRNPLNGLTGMLELLHEGELKPRERDLARSLKACAENLTRVSEEVLGYSKLEYGYVTLRPRPFTVANLFAKLIDLFRVPAAREGVIFQVKLADGFVDGFLGDDEKIKIILGNFVGNALKYAPGSSIELTADAQPVEGGMIDLFFEVTDQGPGVPEAEQELIFQKFVRGSSAKESETPGTGLGLATCRMLAKAMNGSVGLESPPRGGATFYLRVLVKPATPSAPAEKFRDETPNADNRRALIVDDEPYNQTVLRGVALDLGYEPTTCADAGEALAALGRVNFDVVFLDWELPGTKGGDVARRIRARPEGARAIVIATTAHDSDEIRRLCAEAGMDGFLLKPYSKERIRQMIENIRAGRNAGLNFPVATEIKNGAAPSPSSPLNLEAFALYRRGSADNAAGDARADYIDAVEKEVGLLRPAEKREDMDLIRSAAHRLRALAGLIGAQDLLRIARQLESASPKEATRLTQELSTVWDGVKRQLD